MLGLMQDWPLTLDRIVDHAALWNGGREVVGREPDGGLTRSTYAQIRDRARRFSGALAELGVRPGDRIATLAWNGVRHLQAWYAIMGMGAVCHTLNPRLFADQLVYIVNHAGDRMIIADPCFAEVLTAILPRCPAVERVIFLADSAGIPDGFPGAMSIESLIAADAPPVAWGGFDENTAAGLCYTSGTTGDPKGVLYSHRSNFLHTLAALQRDMMGLSVTDTVLMVVPMFHANAWGLAFSAPACGAKLVLPGPRLDGASVLGLLEGEGVTFSAAVPTVWQGLLDHLRATGQRLTTLKRVAIGGSACPEVLIRAFHDDYGVEVVHAWGMTETSPLGTMGSLTPELAALPFEQQLPTRLKQGRAPVTMQMKVVEDSGATAPADGRSIGRLMVRGPYVAGAYFGLDGTPIIDGDGFFDTGDVAHIDPEGWVQITDRSKDVVKSGGEWISSIEIENIAVGHPKAALCAVVGMPHPKWGERPVLLVQLKPGMTATAQEFLDHLKGRIAKWWTPDAVYFVETIPLGGTGKIDKKRLRADLPGIIAAALHGTSG